MFGIYSPMCTLLWYIGLLLAISRLAVCVTSKLPRILHRTWTFCRSTLQMFQEQWEDSFKIQRHVGLHRLGRKLWNIIPLTCTWQPYARFIFSNCRNTCQSVTLYNITKFTVNTVFNDKMFNWIFTMYDAVKSILHRGHLAKSGLLPQSQKRKCRPVREIIKIDLCC